ncbi:DUF3768 domain-containing protein [Laribacter hongkongensis]|uniref:DUF3768 domain-containing protein n=1 Tax=Laribacter hongkongensis TaxID=168471 RepID=UPI001EFC7859|nr:DUF3768 domain-containing protein [Laribacter hongkongensis]MCG9056729.1 DUF3768 domain-containing protein [Laribacter hongkongensis]
MNAVSTNEATGLPVSPPVSVSPRALCIRQLNDALRTSLGGGRWMLTTGFRALPPRLQVELLQAVRTFDAFDAGNDPWGEHDFGAVEAGGVRVFWKIDCHDPELRSLSADLADPARIVRVLTVMLAEEY